jgi:hypothetical protein
MNKIIYKDKHGRDWGEVKTNLKFSQVMMAIAEYEAMLDIQDKNGKGGFAHGKNRSNV